MPDLTALMDMGEVAPVHKGIVMKGSGSGWPGPGLDPV